MGDTSVVFLGAGLIRLLGIRQDRAYKYFVRNVVKPKGSTDGLSNPLKIFRSYKSKHPLFREEQGVVQSAYQIRQGRTASRCLLGLSDPWRWGSSGFRSGPVGSLLGGRSPKRPVDVGRSTYVSPTPTWSPQ